ncbi:SH3 domain-binding protein 5 homolog isoform X2 [Odontomachus brunneus]|uniref:SH3 domain-binding protein 5 homolog isoform X2 n=1 Tax=Odontomachus brunneus TaxID=486640 RepID=UPI0013F1CBCF|nr:SH3 domain-binding protein 5 homolog isoform X2 [Odontomachus brunneus]
MIQIELENLNNATDDINKLETELDEAHTAFRQLLSDTTRRLKEITDKLGTSCIEKARCYYEALEMARQAQVQCQQQAQLFQRASEIHAAAKETVALAEARFMSHQHEWNFDQAWQDMLNHATIKVMDAENQKAECGREHHRRAMLFHDAEKKLVQLEEKHRRSIIKARPYFEVKAQCDQMLATQKERVEHLQQTVKEAKRNYATSLRTLEDISNQIHQQRRDYDIVVNGPREPGVGAELIGSDTCQKREKEFSASDNCKISSIRYNESGNNEKLRNIEKPCLTKEDTEKLDKRSVDGSESKFTQWELELQASMEKLNRLSLENPLYIKERENALTSADLPNTVEDRAVSEECYDFLSVGQLNAHSLSQLPRSTKDSAILEKDAFTDGSSHLKRSFSTTNSITTQRSPTAKVVSKSNTSKSLSSSPVNRRTSNFENRNITEKAASVDMTKYVPNRISQFNVNGKATQSSWTIGVPNDVDVDVINKRQKRDDYSNTNDNLVSKSHLELTNLPYTQASRNVEFLPAKTNSLEGVGRPTNSQDDATLLPIRSSCNISQKSASCSANSSPIKLKKSLTSSSGFSDSEISEQHLSERSAVKKFAVKTASIKELPLLSLFGQTSTLSAIRGKSCSMIDLDSKQNLKMLLDNSRLGDIQAVSAERLAYVRHKLVNDNLLATKTNDVKK